MFNPIVFTPKPRKGIGKVCSGYAIGTRKNRRLLMFRVDYEYRRGLAGRGIDR